MSRGPWVKVYRSLWDGTLGCQPEACFVFLFMLAHCDPDGIIEMTPKAIAARSGFDIEAVKRAIQVLEQPDPESRTPNEDGRRIVPLDHHRSWGWRIVNYKQYRDMTDAERKAAERHRRRVETGTCHAKSRDVTHSHAESRGVTNGHQAEEEADGMKHPSSLAPPQPPAPPLAERARARARRHGEHPDFAAFYDAYPRRIGRKRAHESFKNALQRHVSLESRDLIQAAHRFAREDRGTEERYKPYPAKWLDDDRFLEFLQDRQDSGSPVVRPTPPAPMFTAEETAPPTEEAKAEVRRMMENLNAKIDRVPAA